MACRKYCWLHACLWLRVSVPCGLFCTSEQVEIEGLCQVTKTTITLGWLPRPNTCTANTRTSMCETSSLCPYILLLMWGGPWRHCYYDLPSQCTTSSPLQGPLTRWRLFETLITYGMLLWDHSHGKKAPQLIYLWSKLQVFSINLYLIHTVQYKTNCHLISLATVLPLSFSLSHHSLLSLSLLSHCSPLSAS